MTDLIIILILSAIIIPVIGYMVKRRKKGKSCSGCPNFDQCGGNCHSKR